PPGGLPGPGPRARDLPLALPAPGAGPGVGRASAAGPLRGGAQPHGAGRLGPPADPGRSAAGRVSQRHRGRRLAMAPTLLVPLDGSSLSEGVLPWVEALLRARPGTRVQLLHVQSDRADSDCLAGPAERLGRAGGQVELEV